MERKELVRALENHFGVKAKYMRAPSFAYQIETGDNAFTIDREGKITDTDGKEYKLEEILTTEKHETVKEVNSTDCEIDLEMEGHTGTSLRNLVNMIYSKQGFIKVAFGLTQDIVGEDFSIGINEVKIESIEDFRIAVDDIGERSCPGIIFNFFQNKIVFRFLEEKVDDEKLEVYTQFVDLINSRAKEIKRASSKITISENPRYTFRTFLLRLGMIGNEYKVARKVLLANLEGNIAFRNKN